MGEQVNMEQQVEVNSLWLFTSEKRTLNLMIFVKKRKVMGHILPMDNASLL